MQVALQATTLASHGVSAAGSLSVFLKVGGGWSSSIGGARHICAPGLTRGLQANSHAYSCRMLLIVSRVPYELMPPASTPANESHE
jgi:hypothetical protein